MERTMEQVGKKLYYLGVTMRYKGYSQTIYAVSLALSEPERLMLVSKLIYPDVGKRFGVSWNVAERNIRTAVNVAWKSNPRELCALAGHELQRRPTVSDFIAILADYATTHRAEQ